MSLQPKTFNIFMVHKKRNTTPRDNVAQRGKIPLFSKKNEYYTKKKLVKLYISINLSLRFLSKQKIM